MKVHFDIRIEKIELKMNTPELKKLNVLSRIIQDMLNLFEN